MKSLKKNRFAIIFLLIAGVAGLGYAMKYKNQANTRARACTSTVVTLPDQFTVNAEVASTSATRTKGLGGRSSLAANSGMLFVFPTNGIYPFWMKDTQIPLDIIWLKDSKVVDSVTLEAESTDTIPQHTPISDADAVLELTKGSIATHHIKLGSPITWSGC